jgi:DNA-binding transcriptional MocR family regulator
MLVKRREHILAEPFTYPGFIAAARLHGAQVSSMACDEDGPLIAPLEAQIRRLKPRAIYITPTLQNPTTRTISLARRHALADLMRKHKLTIIEDDPYSFLAPEITPLAQLAPDHVVYISTFSNCISPGLRTAIVVAPSALQQPVREAIRATSLMPTPVWSDLVVSWIEDGTARRIVQAVVAESAARMRIARRILPARASGGPHGFHLWMQLPSGWTMPAYTAAAQARGVVLVASDAFTTSKDRGDHVRVSLGAPADREGLERGLRALAALEASGDGGAQR